MHSRTVNKQKLYKEAIEECRDHPEILRFRLTLNFSYDSMSAKEELSKWAKIIAASLKNDQYPHRAFRSALENYKSCRS